MDVWKASEDVIATVHDLIAKHHPHLASIRDQIAILFREKASHKGDKVVLGASKKAPPVLGVLGDIDYKFIIEIAADEWKTLSDAAKTALLDHHLCACKGVENEQNGEMKFFVQPPDVSFYREEVERHGFWRTDSTRTPDANLILDLFGPDPATLAAAAAQVAATAPAPTKRKKKNP